MSPKSTSAIPPKETMCEKPMPFGTAQSKTAVIIPPDWLTKAMSPAFAHLMPKAGDIAFVSQSGGMITAVLDWAVPKGIGFSHMVSLGGMADVDFGDMLDYLAADAGV